MCPPDPDDLAAPKKPDIDATPTKELFIDMLTRDIPLQAAILDLVDNCVDGARRLRGLRSFKGLTVDIKLNKEGFKISDNCGGIDIDTAKDHAFRFGRPEGIDEMKHSIGRFGVGMKRAIFKIGRVLKIESVTAKDSFKIDLNVDAWSKLEKWGFDFTESNSNQKNAQSKVGTVISISSPKKEVSEAFDVPTFASGLATEVRDKLNSSIENGLLITINGIKVESKTVVLLTSKNLAPAIFKYTYRPEPNKKKVSVVLYCGLGDSDDVTSAGWHVFCNDRQILMGDKTKITGWGSRDSGIKIPNFHGQFNFFRGYAYFDSDEASLLPFNTTKTGVNYDSGIYRTVRLQMIALMRPVVDFCNKLKEERERTAELGKMGPLSKLLDQAKAKPLTKIKCRSAFIFPSHFGPSKGHQMQKITYERPKHQLTEVKKALKAGSAREVGEMTFEFYYNTVIKR